MAATLGAIIVALSTATVDFPTTTIVWVACVVAYQRVENYVVQPLVYGRVLGVLGMLLAVPITAVIQIVPRDWWANRGTDFPAAGHPLP